MVGDVIQPGAGFIAAIGNFDGVHRGHQYLLDETARFAAAHGARPGVVVFDPHPRIFFRPDDPPFLLTTPEQRDAALRTYGAEEVFCLAFDERMASLSPESFVNDILGRRLGLAGVVVGTEFRFGAKRAGDAKALVKLGEAAGLRVKLIDPLAENLGTEKFGSSQVRAALRDGNVKTAAHMLGRPWAVRGIVREGQKLGRNLGFATANLMLGALIEPRKGVYAVKASTPAGEFNGVANFGRRPTVGAAASLLEAHLFDFEGDLYGAEIEVAFLDFIRDEQRFDGLEALKRQIEEDCRVAREKLA